MSSSFPVESMILIEVMSLDFFFFETEPVLMISWVFMFFIVSLIDWQRIPIKAKLPMFLKRATI